MNAVSRVLIYTLTWCAAESFVTGLRFSMSSLSLPHLMLCSLCSALNRRATQTWDRSLATRVLRICQLAWTSVPDQWQYRWLLRFLASLSYFANCRFLCWYVGLRPVQSTSSTTEVKKPISNQIGCPWCRCSTCQHLSVRTPSAIPRQNLCCSDVLNSATQSASCCPGAAHVVACEWNPNALAALRLNLEANEVDKHCTVEAGDCTSSAPKVSKHT